MSNLLSKLKTILGVTFLTLITIVGLNTIDVINITIYKNGTKLPFDNLVYQNLYNILIISFISIIAINIIIKTYKYRLRKNINKKLSCKIDKRFFRNEFKDVV